VRRYFGMLVMVSILFLAAGLEISLAAGIYGEPYNSFSVVPRVPITHSYNPINLELHGLPPDFSIANPLPPERAIRAVVVSRREITLLAGGLQVRVIRTKTALKGLLQVARAVHDKSWLLVSGDRTATLSAALLTEDVNFTIGSRSLTRVRLLDRPGVFIGARGGTLSFTGVTIQSYRPAGRTASRFRPFVEAAGRTAMNITGSHFSQLGWNWVASYGVSWMPGATGHVTGSTFEDNYIGAYSDHAADLDFSYDTFRGNALYGLDPHTYSVGLDISHVIAEDNKAIGIIFADNVTHSVISNSVSRDNGEDGIMMYGNSTHNLVTLNSVTGNVGDGLVGIASPDNTFTRNSVTGNRIGVRVEETAQASLAFTGNRIIRNGLTSQGVTLSGSNIMLGNGGQWNDTALREIWSVLGALLLVFSAVLAVFARRNNGPARLGDIGACRPASRVPARQNGEHVVSSAR